MADSDLENTPRRIWPAMLKGLKCRCPKCGVGKLFHHYIEVVEHCPNCGERLDRYNAGLLLPFIVIMIVAHLLVFVMLEMELAGAASPLVYLAVLVPLALILPLLLLPPVKGAIVGLFWSRSLSDELDR